MILKEELEAVLKKEYAQLTFDTEEEFMYFMDVFEKNTKWKLVDNKTLLFASMYSHTAPELLKLWEQLPEMKRLELHENRAYALANNIIPMRKCAYASTMQRVCISGSALLKMNLEAFIRLLNDCKRVTKGNSLLYIVGNMVSAIRSGHYKAIPQKQIYTETIKYLSKFDCGFVSAYWEPRLTSATWQITDDKLIGVYKELLQRYGCPVDYLAGVITVYASDTGNHSVDIHYNLIVNKFETELPLGNIKLDHKGNANIGIYKDNIKKSFAFFEEQMEDVSKLFKVKIKYPIHCMLGLLQKVGVSKEKAYETVNKFKNRFTENTNAYDIFVCICEMVTIEKNKGMNKKNLIQLEEKISRIMKEKWKLYDICQFSWR